jgi:hypothetical protein
MVKRMAGVKQFLNTSKGRSTERRGKERYSTIPSGGLTFHPLSDDLPGGRHEAPAGELFLIDGDGGAGFDDFIGEGVIAGPGDDGDLVSELADRSDEA